MSIAAIIGVISLVILAFIIGWNMSKYKRTNIYPDTTSNSSVLPYQQTGSYRPSPPTVNRIPPPLPRNNVIPVMTSGGQRAGLPQGNGCRTISIYDFPKCPTCRKRNIKGHPQEVFFNTKRRCYYCRSNHYFSGRD